MKKRGKNEESRGMRKNTSWTAELNIPMAFTDCKENEEGENGFEIDIPEKKKLNIVFSISS